MGLLATIQRTLLGTRPTRAEVETDIERARALWQFAAAAIEAAGAVASLLDPPLAVSLDAALSLGTALDAALAVADAAVRGDAPVKTGQLQAVAVQSIVRMAPLVAVIPRGGARA